MWYDIQKSENSSIDFNKLEKFQIWNLQKKIIDELLVGYSITKYTFIYK